MIKNKFWIIFLAAVFAAFTFTVKVYAQDPAPTSVPVKAVSDNDVNQVAKKLYCPVCPNTPLDVCETQACKDWRAQIKDQLSQGWDEQSVMDYFVKQYGERVLAEPERGGFTSLVWMLPVLFVALGLVFVWLVLKGWRRRKVSTASIQPAPVPTSVPKETLDRIESEIRKAD